MSVHAIILLITSSVLMISGRTKGSRTPSSIIESHSTINIHERFHVPAYPNLLLDTVIPPGSTRSWRKFVIRYRSSLTNYLQTATVLINLYIIEIGDCPISVDRDSHQMQYRSSAAEDVAAGPHVAKLRPQRPSRVYLQ